MVTNQPSLLGDEDEKRITIVGSRPPKWDAPQGEQDGYAARMRAVDAFIASLDPDIVVVSGNAKGVDYRAETRALARRLAVESWRPQKQSNGIWRVRVVRFNTNGNVTADFLRPESFGRFPAAAFWRNTKMVERATIGVKAYHDGISRGTLNTMKTARRAGKLLP